MLDFRGRFNCSSNFSQVTDFVAVHPDLGATCALPLEDPFPGGREENQPNIFSCLNMALLPSLRLSRSSY